MPQGTQIGFAVVDAQGVDYAAVSGWLVVQVRRLVIIGMSDIV